MIRTISILAGLVFSFSTAANAQLLTGPDEKVEVQVERAYIPQGFDNNDVTKIVIEGTFPNTCYKLGKNNVSVNQETHEVEVTQTAYVYQEMCLMMLVPFSETVEVGVLRESGEYTVKDAVSTKALGALPISPSRNSGPDDDTYANINEAYVTLLEPGRRVVVLRGQLPGSCWTLTEKKAVLEGKDVVTVLPIMAHNPGDVCDETPIPFSTTVDLPQLKAGRYMLNVRSLSGASINRLLDVM